MKKTMKIFKMLVLVIAFISITSCDDDDNSMKTNTIVDFVEANSSNYNVLLTALQRADGNLETVLDSGGPFTVFAPDNDAFNTFLSNKGFNSINDVPTDVLSEILLNHVISGTVKSSDLSTGYIETLSTATPNENNMNMYINTNNGIVLNGYSTVTSADNMVDNGVIHLVDKVIDLPTVVTFATADGNFTSLVAALTRSDLTFDYVTTLSTPDGTSPAPFTIFAPTNQAFADLLDELEVNNLNDIDEPTLKATLDYHAAAGANVLSSDITDGMTVTTLGGDITANTTSGVTLTDANGRVSTVVAADVQASNGVIHAIDKVILPPL